MSTGFGCVSVDMPTPVSATCTATSTRITREDDPAALTPVGITTRSAIAVSLKFDDGSEIDYTTDNRTEYLVTAGADLLQVDRTDSRVRPPPLA